MNARERLQAVIRTDHGPATVCSEDEVRDALDAHAAEVPATAAQGPRTEAGGDRSQAWDTTRRARLAVGWLARELAEGTGRDPLPDVDMAALVEEFGRMRTGLASSWTRAADLLEAVPHHPAALTGPYWYGRGWDDAVHHLRDLADGMKPAPRRASPRPDDPKGRP
ncbi:hypothetical protein [Kitasatospora sp. NPDC001547]|uniref:hypothetical protein n=1 Tax=Kitasatospora sp. NPDC001547 TaxID=3364015 RepID=UPI0036CB415B